MMCIGCSQDRSRVGGTVIVSEGVPWVERADTVWDSEGKASGESCRIEAAFQRTKEGRGSLSSVELPQTGGVQAEGGS